MSNRLGIAVAITIVVIVLAVIGVLTMRGMVDDIAAPIEIEGIDTSTPINDGPFTGFTQTQISLAEQCLDVIVADETSERSQGLRGVESLAGFDGMLFVNPTDVESRFTMSTVIIPLDVGWYDADGVPVGTAEMDPCPTGTDAECPTYGPDERYRYALETMSGGLGSGPIGGCTS